MRSQRWPTNNATAVWLIVAITAFITTPNTLAIKPNAAFIIPAPPRTSKNRHSPSLTIPTASVSLTASAEDNGDKDGNDATINICKEYKTNLLRAVSSGDRTRILLAARDLENIEAQRPDATKVGGNWSLIYSTQTDAIAGMDSGEMDSVFDSINAVLYKFFFKFAPFLAGGQERQRRNGGGLGSNEEGGGGSGSGLPGVTVRNEQLVNITSMGVDNRVLLRLGGPKGPQANVRVVGDLTGNDPLDLGVTFTSFSVEIPPGPKIDIPLPRPNGRLRTTYCDDDMRLSRGGRGGIFVLKRMTTQKG
mmetsp:Transcript_9776/g.14502  ORF Transcript_9776/g.14502 Transcript_9776/m.14502 type:complete len:305 (+) Transcript_9776:3-917(+)